MNGPMNSSNLSMPPEGSKVRLIGLKNPNLNGKIGNITNYSSDGERVMVSLIDGTQGIIKVKPKQIEVIDESSGRGRPGMQQRQNSSRSNIHMRSASQDSQGLRQSTNRQNFNGNSSSGRRMNNRGNTRRQPQDNFRDDVSRMSQQQASKEAMETLRSADAMFDLADTSGDGLISQEEFEYYMEKHTNHDVEMIRECFYTIDADNNGDISRDEVRNAFLKKRREMKGSGGGGSVASQKKGYEDELLAVSRDADELFDRADIDGSGELSLRELEIFLKRHTSHSDHAIKDLIEAMDTDKNGYITREEVRRVYIQQKKGEGGKKKTLTEILGLKEDDMAEIEDDVYNMFFLAETGSISYWFAISVFLMKLGLIIMIAIDLFTTGVWPDGNDVKGLVKTTQFLLLPVNVSVQEELITTFYVYANLKWSKEILEVCPGASKGKYHLSNLMRFLDGIAFLFINTTLLLQAEQVLGAFLNFAALQFLSSIDNVALHLARDGYLTDSLELVARDVLLMRLPKNHNDSYQIMDSVMLVVVFLVQLVAWVMKNFVLTGPY